MKLDQAYDRLSFQEFLEDFLPGYIKDTRKVDSTSKLFDSAVQLGSSAELDLLVFEISLDASIEKRIAITTDAFKLMKQYQAYRALIVFRTDNDKQWRLSLMTSTPTIVEGKVLTKLSNPRRLSYLLGENAKVVTPHKYLIKVGRVVDYADLQKRFSVEVVNNEFYKEVAKLYDSLVGADDMAAQLKYPDKGDSRHQFAVRLIGRTVFCWFLREKHSDSKKPLIGRDVLSLEAASRTGYYHSVMAPMFFEVLNKPNEKRSQKFQEGSFGDIPYLNGGLFSPQHDDYYRFDSISGVSIPGVVDIPDEWIRDFFELLETYHFTVDENTSVDIDLSIDPEMLGRIFENLLARINPETGETVRKSTGSFYTPREIVEYMVDESLTQYLLARTSLEESKLRALISYNLNDDQQHPLQNSEKGIVVKALGELKILDPACGSGAFPIGILQKIVFILQQIDSDAKFWFEEQIANTSPEVRHLIEREFQNKNFDYIRKLGVIRKSIFGVDIQPIATEIARLRCFLTLIVDERVTDNESNRGVYPLPNLDFKFVTANTLIKLSLPRDTSEDQTGLFEDQTGIDELKQLRDDYFNSHNSERDTLKLQFSQAQNRMLQNMIINHSHGYSDVTQRLSTWDPFSHNATNWFDPDWMFGVHEGFDIVIANPPYVRQENYKEYKDDLKSLYPDVFDGRADLYTYFIKLGFNLLKPAGILAFITSNKYLVRGYGKKIRGYLSKYVHIKQIVNFGELPVFNASVDSAILIATNDKPVHAFSKLQYVQAKTAEDISAIRDLFVEKHNEIDMLNLGEDVWVLEDPIRLSILDKIKKQNNRLGSISDIFGGIKTGLDEAFVISLKQKTELIEKDPHSAELIKPWFRGREVKKWFATCDQFVIYIPQNVIDIDNYPAIKSHLLKFKTKLEKRATNQKWYEMQQPQMRFTELFEGEKIIYSEIAKEMRAFKDNTKAYGTMKMFFIPYNPVVLAILNSRLFDWYARMTFSSLGDPWNGGRLEFKSMYMSKLPLPPLDGENQEKIAHIVNEIASNKLYDDSMGKEIDTLIYKLYGINEEEIQVIESKSHE